MKQSVENFDYLMCLFSYSSLSMCRASAPPFLVRSRPQALRISGRALTISFQGEALLGQLQVIGGNKTGVFVHHVTEGSPAHNAGISSGAQILEVLSLRRSFIIEKVLFCVNIIINSKYGFSRWSVRGSNKLFGWFWKILLWRKRCGRSGR